MHRLRVFNFKRAASLERLSVKLNNSSRAGFVNRFCNGNARNFTITVYTRVYTRVRSRDLFKISKCHEVQATTIMRIGKKKSKKKHTYETDIIILCVCVCMCLRDIIKNFLERHFARHSCENSSASVSDSQLERKQKDTLRTQKDTQLKLTALIILEEREILSSQAIIT